MGIPRSPGSSRPLIPTPFRAAGLLIPAGGSSAEGRRRLPVSELESSQLGTCCNYYVTLPLCPSVPSLFPGFPGSSLATWCSDERNLGSGSCSVGVVSRKCVLSRVTASASKIGDVGLWPSISTQNEVAMGVKCNLVASCFFFLSFLFCIPSSLTTSLF